MNRREFLAFCVAAGASISLGGFGASANAGALSAAEKDGLRGLPIADPHAHPNPMRGSREYDRTTPNVELISEVGMAVCSFSAVGDWVKYRGRSGSPYSDAVDQLQPALRLERDRKVQRVLNAADVRFAPDPDRPPGALLAIEGGDALEGQMKHLEEFHALGVRMITLMHDHDNEIGFNCRSRSDGPLTAFGVQLVEKMNQKGMLVDVAHAKTETLKSIAAVSAAPVIDSHTSPLPEGYETADPTRLRTWPEMETIARTGGIICTWPFAETRKDRARTTLKHWAQEIALMKSRLGIEHCGWGTDSGGGLPKTVEGWVSYASLPKLIEAIGEAGLSQSDTAAFLGGNFLRLLKSSLG